MKWRSREGRHRDEVAIRKEGDIKVFKRFALWPTVLTNKDTVWLRRYKTVYRWSWNYSTWFVKEKCVW